MAKVARSIRPEYLQTGSGSTHDGAVRTDGNTGEVAHILLGELSTAGEGEGTLAPAQLLGGLAGCGCTDGDIVIEVSLNIGGIWIRKGDGVIGIARGILQQNLTAAAGDVRTLLADKAGVGCAASGGHSDIVALRGQPNR